jgi:hypothetical protein
MEEMTMKGYKGFDSSMKCRDMQYKIGETFTHEGTVSLCNSGLHFCEHPLDVLSYYKPNDGSIYAEVSGDNVSDKTDGDSKRVAKSLTVKAKIEIPALVKAAISFVFEKVSATTGNSAHSATTGNSAHSATTGNCAHSASTGDCAHSATTGYFAHSATTGDCAHSATTGYSAHSATTGDCAHSATTGNYAHSATTGNYAHSATTGYYAHSATTGNSAHSATTGKSAHSAVKGEQCIAASFGMEGQAKGSIGNWLVLAEWVNGKIKAMGIAHIDGNKIKADVFYVLKNGKFVEAS